jgi:hypothetical protein
MGKKTRYVRLDWTSAPDMGPSSSLRQTPIRETGSSSKHDLSTSAHLATKIKELLSQKRPSLSEMPTNSNGSLDGASEATSKQKYAIHPLLPSVPPRTITPFKPTHTATDGQAVGLLALSSALPTTALFGSTPTTHLPQRPPESCLASSNILASLPQNTEKLFPRNPVQTLPVPGKIYFLPGGKHFPTQSSTTRSNKMVSSGTLCLPSAQIVKLYSSMP